MQRFEVGVFMNKDSYRFFESKNLVQSLKEYKLLWDDGKVMYAIPKNNKDDIRAMKKAGGQEVKV